MLETLQRTQETHKKIHSKMMGQCLEEDKFRQKEIREAKEAQERSKNHLQKCTVSWKNARTQLPLLQSTHDSYTSERNRAQKQRDVERKKYEERRQAFREGIAFVRHFIDYANKASKGVSLVELSENLLIHANKLNAVSYTSDVLVSIATEMATQSRDAPNNYSFSVSKSLKQKLDSALSGLLNRLLADEKLNNSTESAAAAVFAKYKARLDKVIDTLAKNISRVKKQIVDMKNCMDREQAVIKSANSKNQRNTLLLVQATKMCQDFNKEFIDATYHRLDEIKTMQEILAIVSKRFSKLPKDLVEYLQTVSNGWIKYINSTEFKKFVEYKRLQYVVNARGRLLQNLNADKDPNPLAAVVRGAKGI
jgi:hypothetical protein